ncbi:hypothetical protein LCGC14_2349870 [marine sediment metagenome]|uniref:HNH nuclease domain-containing protein n=1 Tax=marine sediment metagenome TaxID=412755 RepID=A0A0F9C9E2_9ZZZZ
MHWSKNPQMRKKVLEKIVGTQFKKGQPPLKGMLGKKQTDIWKKEQSERLKEQYSSGKRISYFKDRISWNKGKKGLQVVWNKGIKGSIKPNKTSFKEGKKNMNWQGGKSFEPYDRTFNNKFKRLIRKRDNQICMLCKIHREKLNRALDVHHIDYDKLLSIPQNCISLCLSCHIKTNGNRKQWIYFFQSLLNKLYDYQYENGKIILEIKSGQEDL